VSVQKQPSPLSNLNWWVGQKLLGGKNLSFGCQGQVAEIVFDGFTVTGRHAVREILQGASLFTGRHASPFLDKLANFGRIDTSRTAGIGDTAFRCGR